MGGLPVGARKWYGAASGLLAALLTISCVWVVSWHGANAQDVVLSNEYIAITVNARSENTGRFAIRTTGGDPDRFSDNDAHLLYQLEDTKGPWTSFSTFLIDGDPWVYGGRTRDTAGRGANYGEPKQLPTIVDGTRSVSAWQLGPIEVTQTINIVRSSTTGLMDTAKIVYDVHNTDEEIHSVGIRMTLDTMLGDNDGAPFRVGDLAVTTDTVFSGSDIPEFWQAFDSLEDPKVTAQGTLRGGEVTRPDKVFFTNWATLSRSPWDIDFVPGRDFTRIGGFELDSAMALLWEPAALAPKARRTVVIYFGLGGITIAPGQLQLGVTCPSTVVGGETADSFPVVAYVQNLGSGEARELRATINLPAGLRLAPGQETEKWLGSLPVGQTAQTSWRVRADEGAGRLNFSVGVAAMNADPNVVTRSVEVVAPARLKVTLSEAQAKLNVMGTKWDPLPYPVSATISNVGQALAIDVKAEWSSSRGLKLASSDMTVRHIGTLEPGETYLVRWHVSPTGEVGDLPFRVQATLPERQGEATASGLIRVPPLEAAIDMQVGRLGDRSADPMVAGDTFLLHIQAYNLKAAHAVELEVVYDPTRLRLLGGPLGVDRGTLFVQGHASGGEEYLGWKRPKVWIDISKPLARVAVAGDRAHAQLEPVLSGSMAVLRFQALKPGSTEIRIDKIAVRDRDGQELLVSTKGVRVTVSP